MASKRALFSGKLGVILTTVGSAVGLGNIWRFPYITGENGGSAFIIVYIACVILLGIPAMLAEFSIGRATHSNPSDAYKKLAPHTPWHWVGKLGILVGVFILAYYPVVSGWTLSYLFDAITTKLTSYTGDYGQYFNQLATNAWMPLIWMVVVLLLSHIILCRGVQQGLERVSKVIMPVLFVLLIIMAVHSCLMPGGPSGLRFLLVPDFSKLNAHVVLMALGQAFFSLSLGMGCLITYSSYFKEDINLGKSALMVIVLDTLVALVSGFIIFPAVFTFGMEPQEGAGLAFIVLPGVFSKMSVSFLWATLFYLLLFIAALTSLMSIHEAILSYVTESWQMSRKNASRLIVLVLCVLGVLSSWSFGPLSQFKLFGLTLFDSFDFITSSVLMPLGALLTSLFVGWKLKKQWFINQLTNQGTISVPLANFFWFLLRYFVPLCIFIIFVGKLLDV